MISEAKASSGETEQHRRLKALGKRWLKEQGCGAVATEVRLPLSAYRVDVAGYRKSGKLGVFGETFALECKQSRADFLRDAGVESECGQEWNRLRGEVASLRALLAVHLPDCRAGVSLFREYDAYDFSDLRHERWRRMVARLDQLERRLADGVKFSRIVRYASACFCYLVVAEGVLKRMQEVPLGWGCLVETETGLKLEREATRLACRDEERLAMLERIAARAGR